MKIQDNVVLGSSVHHFRNRSRFPLPSLRASSGLKVFTTIFGVMSAVGIILALKDSKVREFISMLSFSIRDTSSFWVVPGLENHGNSFLNFVLQSLSSCSSFRKYLAEIAELDFLLAEKGKESMPLFNSLALLLEELGIVRHKRIVLSPRGMMLLMDRYKPNFSFTRQQDAEEAFSHLLSMLRQELSDHYVPNTRFLHPLSCGRIITEHSEKENEWQMWKRVYLGPFDGILASILICPSCSFQISLDFQEFHTLHLSPFDSNSGPLVDGYSLEDHLKHFFAAEPLDTSCCSNCWHNAAIHYLSILSENKTDNEILQLCNRNDSCNCRTLSSLKAFQYPNKSRIVKQSALARSPKILCIHLQGASYGQSDHISFPSILDLSPFTMLDFRIKKPENLSHLPEVKSIYQNKVVVSLPSSSLKTPKYRLVSIVEHSGRSCTGHYTVYRRVISKIGDEYPAGLLQSAIEQWYRISDSEVLGVSEKEALCANACMLFYEKINSSRT